MGYTTEFADKLASYGIDYADAMDRFGGNDALFERLLFKYLDDRHYVNLVAALAVNDYEEAYRQAHSLKGVAGNLSLAELYHAAAKVSDSLRINEAEMAKSHMPAVEAAHARALEGLEKLEAGRL